MTVSLHDGLRIAADEYDRLMSSKWCVSIAAKYGMRHNKRLTSVMGRCVYPRDGSLGRIEMSTSILTSSEYHIRQTVIHEVAHALTPGKNHGPEWVKMARTLGYDGGRLFTDAQYIPAPKLVAQCPGCGWHYGRQRQPKRRPQCWCGSTLQLSPNVARIRLAQMNHPKQTRGWLTDQQLADECESLAYNVLVTDVSDIPVAASEPVAPAATTTTGEPTIETLLDELRGGVDKRRGQQIRRRLRAMGHRGGLRG